jgi:hypothetical protein
LRFSVLRALLKVVPQSFEAADLQLISATCCSISARIGSAGRAPPDTARAEHAAPDRNTAPYTFAVRAPGPFGFGPPPSRRDGRAISCLNAETGSHAIRRITTRTPTEAVDLFSIGRKH